MLGFAKVTRHLSERKRRGGAGATSPRSEEARRTAELNEENMRVLASRLSEARRQSGAGGDAPEGRVSGDRVARAPHPLSAILGWARMLSQGGLPEHQGHPGHRHHRAQHRARRRSSTICWT